MRSALQFARLRDPDRVRRGRCRQLDKHHSEQVRNQVIVHNLLQFRGLGQGGPMSKKIVVGKFNLEVDQLKKNYI